MVELLAGGMYGLVFESNAIWKEQRRFALHALRDLGFSNAIVQVLFLVMRRCTDRGSG